MLVWRQRRYRTCQIGCSDNFRPGGGAVIPKALKDVDKGDTVICGGIHMSEIPAFPYDLLWEERMLKSVANLTHTNGIEFFELLKGISVETQTTLFELQQANETLDKFRKGEISGAAVLVMG